ncbi:lasso peptide biosynthesis B2 protein [Billgrantia sp. Q4P2]|uniref:lasso peptide biosynthesis B2 protein n=1 Tax=Billgrantia sp. Q4P2 TaxID=3463857 RepID=UPI004056C8AE
MKTLRRFLRLPWCRKALLLEGFLWLALAWVLVRGLPFRFWSHWLGHQMAGEVDMVDAGRDLRVQEICRSITAINARLGGRFTCLMLAMATQWMMHRRRISSCLVLGTLTEQDSERRLSFKAHAWVKDASGVILGNPDEPFVAISSFVRRYPSREEAAR